MRGRSFVRFCQPSRSEDLLVDDDMPEADRIGRRRSSGRVERDEVCYTKPPVELEPFAPEHEVHGRSGEHRRPLRPPGG